MREKWNLAQEPHLYKYSSVSYYHNGIDEFGFLENYMNVSMKMIDRGKLLVTFTAFGNTKNGGLISINKTCWQITNSRTLE